MEQKLNSVFVQKNTEGNIFFTLDDYFGEKPLRIFELSTNKPVAIPVSYALSMYVDPGVKRLIDANLIILARGKEQFLELVKEYLSEEEAQEVEPQMLTEEQVDQASGKILPLTDEQIIAILSNGRNKTKIEELFSGDELLAERAYTVANANYDKLSYGVIQLIESITKMGVGLDN